MGMKLADRVNEGRLVFIIDERGAHCASEDSIPQYIKAGYLIQDYGNGVVICKKVFNDANQTEMVGVDGPKRAEREKLQTTFAGMKKLIGPFERITPMRCHESRSHSRGKPQYPRQDEVDHFRFARKVEQLVAPAFEDHQRRNEMRENANKHSIIISARQ